MCDDAAELREHVSSLAAELAEYRAEIGYVVELLGHVGDTPDDLRDAVGQLEALLSGEESTERADLTGLAELVRAALYDRDRARELARGAEQQCARRTAEIEHLRAVSSQRMLVDATAAYELQEALIKAKRRICELEMLCADRL